MPNVRCQLEREHDESFLPSFLLSIAPVASVIISFLSVFISLYAFRNASDQTRLEVRKELTGLVTQISVILEDMQQVGVPNLEPPGPTSSLVTHSTVYFNRLAYLAQQAIIIMTRWPGIYVSVNDLYTVISTLAAITMYADDAETLGQRALRIARKSPSRGDKILAYRINGLYYFFIGHVEEGRSYFRQALQIRESGEVMQDAELARDSLAQIKSPSFRLQASNSTAQVE